MADSFFGFDASLPSLGEGYRDDDQASAIDLLNDETFGDGALEGDWEEFHDHFVGVDPNGGTNTKQTNDLEDSLNHLVLDDEEDDNGGFGRGIPMKQRRPADLDHLFGPASPPGLLNTEQLLSGQNIWGSPVTRESDVHRQQEDGLKSLLKQLQAPPQAHTSYLQNPSIASMQLSNSLPNAKSLHEIENTMMQGPPPSGDGRPRALTVEELEKQLQMSHPSGALQSSKIAPIGTPPTSGSYLQHNFRNMPGGMAPPAPRENPNIVLADMSQPPPGFNPLQQQPQQQPQRRVSPTNMAQPNTDTQSSVKGGTSPPSNSTPFMANTPVQQRMPAPVAPNTDPTHQRGHTQNTQPGGNVRQNLFNNAPRGKPAQPNGVNNGHQQQPQQQQRQYNNYHDRDNRGNNHHDNYDNRDNFRDNRDNYRDNRDNYRDNYRDRGNNFHDNDYYHDNHHYRGDHRDFNHRGYHDNRGGGDFHRDYDRDFGNRDRYDRDYNRDYQRDYRKRGPGQHHYHRQRYDSQGYDDEEMYEDRGDGRDEYAGLMSKKEKDWIIKIQLMQLQTENPYLDDFYYTTWQLKKMHTELEKKRLAGKLSKDKNSEPKLVLPHLEGKAENKNYKPVQFENSLGRLTAASVHNPRQALQLAKSNSLDKDDKNKEVKKIFKGLLIDVEKCYDALLEIDDIEKRVLALPQESRMPLLEDRHHIINQLFGHLACENNNQSQFLKYLSLRKGVTFIARLLPLLSKEDALSMVRAVLRNLSTISKREWQDEVLPRMLHTMSCVIDEVDLEGLVGLAAALLATNGADPSINHALQNNFGVSVICGLVSRGEEIYTTCNPLQLDVQHQNAWRQFILKLADAVHGTAQTQLVHPTTCAASSLPLHMRRLVDKQTYFSIQDKLQQLTTTA